MNVAVPRDQHSLRFGQRASVQTVCKRSPLSRPRVSSIPRAGIGRRSHGGKRRPDLAAFAVDEAGPLFMFTP
jgi:hypothetical protein